MDWHSFLTVTHVIGTILGVGGATFAEIFLLKALRDGGVDPIESSFMQVTYRVIRVGLVLLVLSGFGFLILYRLEGLVERLYSAILWAKLSIVVIILINAILLEMRRIPLWLGSALSFASWYVAMMFPVMWGVFAKTPYVGLMAFYIGAVVVVALVLTAIRRSLGINI